MQDANHLMEILTSLSEAGVEYVIAGGVAVVLQGVERATMDLDLSVSFQRQNVEMFLAVMKKHGLVPRAPVPAETLLDSEVIEKLLREKGALVFTFIHPKDPFKQVDVFLKADLRYEVLVGNADVMPLGDLKVRVLSKEQLISIKSKIKPPRDKDTFDVAALRKLIQEKK